MGIVVKSKGSDEEREPIPPGNYLGVIVGVYDIGTQEGAYGAKHQIITLTELHKKRGPATDGKGRNFVIPTFYSLTFGSMNGKKSKLRSDVETITARMFSDEEAESKGFDVETLLGMAYRLTIVAHQSKDGKPLGKIASLMALDEDDSKPSSTADEVYYELDPREGIPKEVPTWIGPFIQRSKEWVAVHGVPKTETGGMAPAIAADAWGEAPF
jgi:hypothetical protein